MKAATPDDNWIVQNDKCVHWVHHNNTCSDHREQTETDGLLLTSQSSMDAFLAERPFSGMKWYLVILHTSGCIHLLSCCSHTLFCYFSKLHSRRRKTQTGSKITLPASLVWEESARKLKHLGRIVFITLLLLMGLIQWRGTRETADRSNRFRLITQRSTQSTRLCSDL